MTAQASRQVVYLDDDVTPEIVDIARRAITEAPGAKVDWSRVFRAVKGATLADGSTVDLPGRSGDDTPARRRIVRTLRTERARA